MRAAVVHDLGSPVVIEDVAKPEPAPGEVLIKVEACGVCHSDLHLARGDWDLLRRITKVPLIGGHEVAGIVAELGDGVAHFKIGDRVGVPWLYWTCGECEYCKAGRETLCGKQKITGCMVDGGFAEFMTAPASHAVKLPDSLSAVEAAPLLCAALTVYSALKRSDIAAGETLLIFGIGGLGHLAVQIARAMGVHVCAVDLTDEKLALAHELGAEWTINASTEQVHKRARAIGGAHVTMITSASSSAYEIGLRCLRKGGTLVVVGMPNEPFKVSAVSMVSSEARIVASSVGTREELREMFELVKRSSIRCHVTARPLEDLSGVYDEMQRNAILGRVVLTL